MSRFHRSSQDSRPTNAAEWLLELGKTARKQFRHGAGVEAASRRFDCPRLYCHIVLAFMGASDLVKLRALVEDRPLGRIIRELGPELQAPKKSRKVSQSAS